MAEIKGITILHSLPNRPEGIVTMNGNGEEEPEDTLTYFVDEDGRYYYQPAGDNQSLVSIPASAVTGEPEVVNETNQIMVEHNSEEEYQTISLVPSENVNGEVSYVLVVQEENRPNIVNINLKQEDKDGNDVYIFEEENNIEQASEPEEPEAEGKQKSSKKTKKSKVFRACFTCNFCNYTSHRRYLLLRHMKSHSEERPHKCDVCERGFKTMASLQNHLNMHNGVKPHVCKYCKNQFTTSGELVRHIRYKHTHEKPHKCTECDYASVELSKLRRHVRCHTGERPYQCPHCTYASPDTFKLKRHLRTHTGEKPYKCDSCNMCFTQSNSLKAHKLIHNVANKPVYACQLCPAKCGRKTDLRIHVQKLHTSDKPLNCKRCGKSFPDRYSCKMHNKTHEGERCYKCELCPYATTTMAQLTSHMYKHTDEKPFTCDHCNQAFRQKNLLRRHQNLYHNPQYVPKPPKEKTHTCKECQRTFARKGNLIRHMAVHDPEMGPRNHAIVKAGFHSGINYIGQDNLVELTHTESNSELLKLGITENELKRGELVTVSDSDGQQYVVLEVIQIEDASGQKVSVVEEQDDAQEEQEEDEEDEEMVEEMAIQQENKRAAPGRRIKLEKDMDGCFGFNVEENEEMRGGQQNGSINHFSKQVLGLI